MLHALAKFYIKQVWVLIPSLILELILRFNPMWREIQSHIAWEYVQRSYGVSIGIKFTFEIISFELCLFWPFFWPLFCLPFDGFSHRFLLDLLPPFLHGQIGGSLRLILCWTLRPYKMLVNKILQLCKVLVFKKKTSQFFMQEKGLFSNPSKIISTFNYASSKGLITTLQILEGFQNRPFSYTIGTVRKMCDLFV